MISRDPAAAVDSRAAARVEWRNMQKNPTDRQLRLQCLAYSAFGLLPLLWGCAITMYIYAFASIVNPRLPADERRAEILRKMFLSHDAIGTAIGLFSIATGVCILLYGVVSLFMNVNPSRFAIRSAIVAGAGALLLAICLFMLA
jgi:hypothetical protein